MTIPKLVVCFSSTSPMRYSSDLGVQLWECSASYGRMLLTQGHRQRHCFTFIPGLQQKFFLM